MIYQTQLEKKVFEIIEATVHHLGCAIVRIRLNGVADSRVLQIMLEKENGEGAAIEDCEKVSKNISTILDVEDPISGEYNLEVSSCGVDRPLTRIEDFQNYKGHAIKLATRLPIEGQKKFKAKITDVVEQNIVITSHDEKVVSIDFNNVMEAQLDYFYDAKVNKKSKKGAK